MLKSINTVIQDSTEMLRQYLYSTKVAKCLLLCCSKFLLKTKGIYDDAYPTFLFFKTGSKNFAFVKIVKFYGGTETIYKGQQGCFNYNKRDGAVYNPENYKDKNGNWTLFIYPKAFCESKNLFIS